MIKGRTTFWAGFVSGKIDIEEFNGYHANEYPMPCLYRRKADALLHYDDVRRVTVSVSKDQQP